MTDNAAYWVYVDDNFHFMDEGSRYKLGTYAGWESAIAACKRIVDDFLQHAYKPGMTSQDLWQGYRDFGEDPFIVGPGTDSSDFSAWNYAKDRCKEICGER